MVVEVVPVGAELLLGNIINTNAQYLAEKRAQLGSPLYYQTAVGDNHSRLLDAVRTGLNRADVLIPTRGLGSTEDDITKEVCAEAMGFSLIEDAYTRELIEEYFKNDIYKEIPDNNWKQVIVPEGATVLDNHNGMVSGPILEEDSKTVALPPEPPNELYPLFEEQAYPKFQKLRLETIFSQMVRVCGIGESQVEDKLIDMIDGQTNPTTAPYAKTGEVHLRITAATEDEVEARELIKPVVKGIKKRLGNMVYSVKDETLETAVVCLLEKYGLTAIMTESYTGDMLATRLVNVPGVSEVFREGFITYSNKAKKKILDADRATLRKYGVVSKEVAKKMVTGGVFATDADICMAITGLAGPDEATEEKPVGLVCIVCYMKDKVTVGKYQFKGGRNKIREQPVIKALDLPRRSILENCSK